ncbi:MAG: diacylglycerol/lipid kinase family protein [Flavisolibacter sp.]
MTDKLAILLSGMDIKHSIFITQWPQTWYGFTEAWIVGGDGTVNWFINQYPDIQLPLSVFPGGTGNDFHWMLYSDLSLERQVDQVLEGKPQLIDAGICNGKLFLNGVGIGFDGAVAKDLVGRKKLAGKGSYLLSILKRIIWYREKACTLQMPHETISQDCFMISIANGQRYGGGFKVAPNASVTDALLDVNMIGKVSLLKRIRYLPVIEKGKHLQLPFVQYKQVVSIVISSKEMLYAHIDGELEINAGFDIEILPKHFSFVC